jgi:hypothetical protein
MKSLDAPTIAALSATEVFLVTLLRIQFPSGVVALNASTFTLTWNGDTYLGASGLGNIAPTEDVPGQVTGATLELQQMDASHIALALDSSDQVQGSPISIYTAVLNGSLAIVHVELDWAGYADTMTISEDGQKCTISLSAESKAVDLMRGNPLLYNDGDQQSLVPGDLYFQYVVSQSDKPVIWPSREFFKK